ICASSSASWRPSPEGCVTTPSGSSTKGGSGDRDEGDKVLKRVGLVLALPLIAMALASCSSTSHQTVAGQIDAATTSTFNLEAIAYFPDKLTVHPGDTVQFHSHFRGERHTVTF